MRQWWKMAALGAVVTMVVATPAAAFGGDRDEAPQGSTDAVAERVMDHARNRIGQADAPDVGDRVMDQEQRRLRDGSAAFVTPRDGDRDRTRLREHATDECTGDCDRDREQLRQRLQDCTDGCEAAWAFANHHGWTLHVAI